jgi:flagellar biosynthesis/type III secretory pathway M-ring protein FliF/YscJ
VVNLIVGGEVDSRLATTAADLVCGAVANLDRKRVAVIINGVSQRVPGRGGDDGVRDAGDNWMALLAKAERYYADKVSGQIAYIPGAMVSVSVKINNDYEKSVKHAVDPKNIVHKPISEDSRNEQNQTSRGAGGDVSLVANSPIAVGATGSAPPTESNGGTTESTKTAFVLKVGEEDVERFNPGGDATVTAASVLVPRSHLLQVYRHETGKTDKEPDETVFQAFVNAQLAQLRPHVQGIIGMTTEAGVHVSMYTDLPPAAALAAATPAAAGTSILPMFTDHVREIVLGLLALASLFMVGGMVRKASPAVAAVSLEPAGTGAKTNTVISDVEEAVGEVAEGASLLDGMEVDDDSVKAQQMLDQVAEMVDENPDTAAALVKRWLNK